MAFYVGLLLAFGLGLGVLIGMLRVPKRVDRTAKDPQLFTDQQREEYRRGLANMQRPAVKGFHAHRHTVTPIAQRRTK